MTGCAGWLRLGPPLVSWPVPSLRSPPGKAVGRSAKRKSSRGARQPGPPLDSWTVPGCLLGPISYILTRGETSAQIPPRTAGGLGRGSPRRLAICSTPLRKLKSPPEGRGAHGGTGPPVRADLPRRGGPSAEGPRPLHPPLEGCRPARGPGGLPGRSLSLSLGRESEARTSGATGVSYLRENSAEQKRVKG